MGKNFLHRLFGRGGDGAEDEGGQNWDVEDRKARRRLSSRASSEHDSDRPSDPAP